MKLFAPHFFLATAALLFSPAVAKVGGHSRGENDERRALKGSMDSGDSGDDDDDDSGGGTMTLRLTILNQSFNQPFSPFFVMVHNSEAERLYVRGQPASEPLAILAEDGNPEQLVNFYTEYDMGVSSVFAFRDGVPFFGGESLQIEVEVSPEYPLVTIATMAIHTNDCFTSLNGVRVRPGMVLDVPGLDAGSEENNEMCNSIPGPGCATVDGGNVRSGNGEGFVHVHRGFFGIGNLLPQQAYDWRNPMMRVVVSRVDNDSE